MPSVPAPHIALVGCGKMGGAMLQGWIDANITTKIDVLTPEDLPPRFSNHVTHYKDPKDFKAPWNILILAVKPQILCQICHDLRENIAPETPILSIAVGQTMKTIQTALNSPDHPIIRTMPNTPAAIGKGITGACLSKHVTPAQKDLAERLLSAMGDVVWLPDEGQMDALSAISGSGPAYVFYLVEALSHAGIHAGLAPEMSMKLARQTIIGAGALLGAESDTDAATLRKNVTSPGGTTEAALKILMDGAFQEILNHAIDAAQARAAVLSKDPE